MLRMASHVRLCLIWFLGTSLWVAQAHAVPSGSPSVTPIAQKDSKAKPEKDNDKPLSAGEVHNPVLWQKPENISQLDLLHGQGGEKHQPKAPFTFIEEDSHGSNPKFDARDADGKKWRVKLGEEARPEVAASRLLWAVGYFVEDDYVRPDAQISGLKLKRGGQLVHDEHVTDARFARKPGGEKKAATWKWKDNPFTGTREFNGLRVMMAVLNDWDLKDENNSVYTDEKNDRQIFLVSDIGATFATNAITNSRAKDKGNVNEYAKSKFITHVTEKDVSFGTPAPPTGLFLQSGGFIAADYMKRRGFDWIGDHIPIADVRWIASLLKQLSHQQIADAFRAAHFPDEESDLYVTTVESRINELSSMTTDLRQ
jgi:hypothetical protein